MGQKIIRFESSGKLGKQSRLWLVEDLLHVLENDMATEAIQAIVVGYKENDFNFEEFPKVLSSKMSNLRLMIIEETDYYYDRGDLAVPNNQRQLFVPNQLRHHSWDYCPLKCLSSTKKLVQLDLKYSRIEYLWEGVMRSVNLKFINLWCYKNLIKTPDFSSVLMLEELDLYGCNSLVEIHPSIGQLSKLRRLCLEGCKSLTDLPCMSAVMQSLTVINLSRYFKLSSFPKFTGIMKSLSEFNLRWTIIKKVPPSSIKCLIALTFLNLNETYLECLPSNMNNLRSLHTLNLTNCEKLKSLRLPSTVRCISVEGCDSLKWLPTRVKLSFWSQPLSQWLPYDERRSPKEFTILFHFLQGLLCRKTVYGTSSKGKEDGSLIEFQIIMPSCLTKIVENSISIELPSNWYNSKWIGLALLGSVSLISTYAISFREVAVGKMPQNHCAFELVTTRMNVKSD
ncbi:probable WRKY transcription factor 19 [Quercus robur]|uniref:probable WRKY transcription factor 19 n=1 Tax=Quercus robur TaxID=38942 RepID=UPI002161BE6F|nr:probable WRKY transcription factor 19 [Quercus robur]